MKKPKVSGYVDFFLLPVQKKNLNAYKRLAKKFAEMVGKLFFIILFGKRLFDFWSGIAMCVAR